MGLAYNRQGDEMEERYWISQELRVARVCFAYK